MASPIYEAGKPQVFIKPERKQPELVDLANLPLRISSEHNYGIPKVQWSQSTGTFDDSTPVLWLAKFGCLIPRTRKKSSSAEKSIRYKYACWAGSSTFRQSQMDAGTLDVPRLGE